MHKLVNAFPMAHFTQALKTVLTRSFEGKQSALSDAAEMHHTDISRLLKETSPVSPEKLGKILLACSQEKDRAVLLHAAVRDFVGEEAYASHFTRPSDVDTLREDLGGPVFTATLPIHPYVERVLRYIIHRVQHDGSVAEALRLIGHFLELPEDSTGVENWVASPAVVDPDAQAALDDLDRRRLAKARSAIVAPGHKPATNPRHPSS